MAHGQFLHWCYSTKWELCPKVGDALCFEITTRPGDVLFMHNHVTVHARAAYEDWPDTERRRHPLRLWLATPGQRPSGIIVEGMDLCAPLCPE